MSNPSGSLFVGASLSEYAPDVSFPEDLASFPLGTTRPLSARSFFARDLAFSGSVLKVGSVFSFLAELVTVEFHLV